MHPLDIKSIEVAIPIEIIFDEDLLDRPDHLLLGGGTGLLYSAGEVGRPDVPFFGLVGACAHFRFLLFKYKLAFLLKIYIVR